MSDLSAAPASRRALLSAFLDAPRALDRCVQSGYPPGLIDWKPPVEGGWTVRQQLVHLADADLIAFTRVCLAVAQSGAAATDWNQEAWCAALHYERQSATLSLQLIRLVRSALASRLAALDEAAWKAASIVHPQRGAMDLEALVALYTGHIDKHDELIKRNEGLWRQASPEERERAKGCH